MIEILFSVFALAGGVYLLYAFRNIFLFALLAVFFPFGAIHALITNYDNRRPAGIVFLMMLVVVFIVSAFLSNYVKSH